MSHSSSPNRSSSIFGWAKSLKRSHLLSNDSVNEISDSDNASSKFSPTKSINAGAFPSIVPSSSMQQSQSQSQSQQQMPRLQPQRSPLNIPSNTNNNNNINNNSIPMSSSISGNLEPGAISPSPSNYIPSPSHQRQSISSHNNAQSSFSTSNYLGTSPTASSSTHDFLRPILNHKSRSTNNVSRVRSNSENSIRNHRDSFLQSNSLVDENSKYFGVPLQQALSEAAAKISVLSSDDQTSGLQYGEIPIVVAKCGVYLKKNGLTVEGIFRVGGSSKRLKELQVIFNTPPDYGKKLIWDGYTVHDAASILRRYLNALPEPLIPLDVYEEFRVVLKERPRIISYMKYKAENPTRSLRKKSEGDSSQMLTEANMGRHNDNHASSVNAESSSNAGATPSNLPDAQAVPAVPAVPTSQTAQTAPASTITASLQQPTLSLSIPQSSQEDFPNKQKKKKAKNYKKLTNDVRTAIDIFRVLLNNLPIASKQLLFYILDLLAMVQSYSKQNLMSARNLAAIFQPSILSHPDHDLDPEEYALSQLVVEFLIQYSYKLLPSHKEPSPPPPIATSASASASANASTDDIGPQDSLSNSGATREAQKGQSSVVEAASASSSSQVMQEQQHLTPRFQRSHSKSLSSTPQHEDIVVGYKHNATECIPDESDVEYEVSDGVGSDAEESYFHEIRPPSTMSSPKTSPMELIGKPVIVATNVKT